MTYAFTKFEGTPLAIVNEASKHLVALAQRELKIPFEGLTVRTLRPQDLGLANPNWTFNLSSSGENTAAVDVTVADQRYIMIYGIKYGGSAVPVTTRVQIVNGGQTARDWNVQAVQLTEDSQLIFTDPVITKQNQTLSMNIFTDATNSAERIGFLGVVVEKKGMVFA